MTHEEIVKALNNLAPKAEWTFAGNDYKDIVWLSDQVKPTLAEIETEVSLLPIRAAQAEEEAKAKKAALLEKLGITEDEARLLLSR